MSLTAVDLCCGGGGWGCAARGLPIRFVAVADVDVDALDTWRENHLETHHGCAVLQADLSTAEGLAAVDAAVTDATGDGRVDLVLGAIPCEQISCARAANKPSTQEMARLYTLIDSLLRWTLGKKPRAWCLEDVIQIERHLPMPLELGSEIAMRRIDAAEFGPQRRIRTFLGSFPDPPKPRTIRTLDECLLPGPWLTIRNAGRYERTEGRVGRDCVRVINQRTKSPTVMTCRSSGHRFRRSYMVEQDVPSVRQRALRCLDWQEAALLQGFPTDYRFVGSMTKAQKLIGQAISIDVGRAILSGIVAEQLG